MELLARRLQERSKQLGISNAEASRRMGIDERRYAHYASGRREPDVATLVRIAEALGTTHNWLLGAPAKLSDDHKVSSLLERFTNAASGTSRAVRRQLSGDGRESVITRRRPRRQDMDLRAARPFPSRWSASSTREVD
ncbi:helix-turn-helix domain-containing protein [Pseudorhizobium pelagicum]|uniref:helix-turn-helix domain-containing protein n=1 Tax=Pseudorhizobium pelagicum TaxID=1509405 RepID=UPI0009DD5FE0|nr:helix-turn-helix domain-containing protein [Pseudorhizobium pelagicum]